MDQSKTRKNILFVEDEPQVRRLLTSHFSKEKSFRVFEAETIFRARKIVERAFINLIVLDLKLPDGTGISFCEEIKSNPSFSEVKVIVLTKCIDIEDKVDSFKHGADDYLPKPFHPIELKIRAEKLLGMLPAHIHNVCRKNITLDLVKLELKINNTSVKLTQSEFFILEHLLERSAPQEPKRIAEFLSLNNEKFINRNATAVTISRLRNKLFKATGSTIIKNRYGIGYYI